VVVIERQMDVLRTVAGLWWLRRTPTLGPEPAIDRMAGGAGGDHCVVHRRWVRSRQALGFSGAEPADDQA
jgi:hypothetical protein